MSGGRDGCIRLNQGNVRDCSLETVWNAAHTLPVTGLCAHQDIACSGGRDACVKMWNLGNGKCTAKREISRNIVTGLAWFGDSTVAQSSEDKRLRVLDGHNNLASAIEFPVQKTLLTCCAVSPCHRYIATGTGGGDDNSILIFDSRNARDGPCATLTGQHTQKVTSVLWSSADRLISCGNDSTVALWSSCTPPTHEQSPLIASVSLAGRALAAVAFEPVRSRVFCASVLNDVQCVTLSSDSLSIQ